MSTQVPEEPDAESSSGPDSEIRPNSAKAPGQKTVVIVGHGMVGQRMCEEIRGKTALDDYRVVVIGADTHAAYDRVHLCRVVQGEPASVLQLVDPSWYDERRIELVRDKAEHIDREKCLVRTQSGRLEHYDHLILATGSLPILGKIPGNEGRDVTALRTIEDASLIRERALAAKDRGLPVVIVGGGLLGIELADELIALGVSVQVLESADYPLSRQLEQTAGQLLSELLTKKMLVFRPKVRVVGFVEKETHTDVEIEGTSSVAAGLVVLAIGVRPADQIARDAELRCDMFGGVLVNDQLLTNDPKISAIGECARHRGLTYGLVAPGYAMAETVAKRLEGSKSTRFSTVQVGTRLKVKGVELTVVGESRATGLGVRPHLFQEKESYRRLVIRRGKVIGITSVGGWKDLPRAEQAMARAEKIRPVQLKRFEADEPMWKGSGLSLKTWPDSATVCTCMGVTCGALKRANREGCETVDALAKKTGASTVCGSCLPLLATLTDETPAEPAGDSPWMQFFSVVSLLGALVFFLVPAVPYSDTVQRETIDALWRTSTYKQYTGFALAGLFASSIVFSMRKRLSFFRFGDFEGWRITHAFLGVLCLVGGFAHTGFRLGSNLDLALATVFLGSTLLGGVAGGWSLVESKLAPERARLLRGWLIRSHIYLLWPLPVLLGFHVAKVYFF